MTTSPICVFVGPSLSKEEAQVILPSATYLPPAKMGDIYNAVISNYSVIGLIDGYFDGTPAPWHKEILYALSQGVHVLGSSSMGALRAAETYEFGMVGVGQIFEWYRDAYLVDDDEVTVIHQASEKGFAPLSEALVNIRYILQRCLSNHSISQEFSELALARAKETFYPERSWPIILGSLPSKYDSDKHSIRDFIKKHTPNLKGDDAKLLLKRLASFNTGQEVIRNTVNFTFEPTIYWRKLTRTMRRYSMKEGRMEHLHRLTKFSVWNDLVRHESLFYELTKIESHRLGIVLDADSVHSSLERFRRDHKLLSSAELNDWMLQRGIETHEISAIAEHHAIERRLYEFFPTTNDDGYVLTLKKQCAFKILSKIADRMIEIYVENGSIYPTPDEMGISLDDLLIWYEKHVRSIGNDLEYHAKSYGLQSSGLFISQLLMLYLVWSRYPHEVIPMLPNPTITETEMLCTKTDSVEQERNENLPDFLFLRQPSTTNIKTSQQPGDGDI
jgi:hypothetical protein